MMLDHGIHLFRMPSFFIIAGYFAALLLSRTSPESWLKSRLRRLGIPLIAAAFLLNPLEPIFHHLLLFAGSKESMAVAWHALFYKASTFYPRIRHLWFLIVLIYYSIATAAIVKLTPPKWTAFYADFIKRAVLRAPWVLFIFVCCVTGVYQMLTYSLLANIREGVGGQLEFLQVDRTISFAPYFIFGFLLARHGIANARFLRLNPFLLVGAGASLWVGLIFYHTDSLGMQTNTAAQLFSAFPALFMAQALLSLAKRYRDKPSRPIDALVRGSFVIYLFHQPFIMLFDEFFQIVHAPVLVEFVVTTLSVTAFSYAMWLMVRSSKVLSLLFDGTWPKPDTNLAVPLRNGGMTMART